VTVATPPFGKIFGGNVPTAPGNTCVKLVVRALTVLELLAFNAQKFRGTHVTVATPPFEKIFGDHVRTVPGNTCVKFELRSFNRFGAIAFNSHDRPLRAHKHTHRQTHTSNERIISAIHFVHLAEIIMLALFVRPESHLRGLRSRLDLAPKRLELSPPHDST